MRGGSEPENHVHALVCLCVISGGRGDTAQGYNTHTHTHTQSVQSDATRGPDINDSAARVFVHNMQMCV